MAYQCKCKEFCPPPSTDVTPCLTDTRDPCTFTDMAQSVQPCDCVSSEACSAPSSLSYQAKQPCPAPSFVAVLRPAATFVPCASPCLSLHADTCAGSACVPCEPVTLHPSSPCPDEPQPCSPDTAHTGALPSPPACGSSCSGNCSAPQGDGGMPYVFPGSIVCLDPSGCVSVKPGVGSPELETSTLFLASYKPHF